jgi:hypothetical protein
VITVANLSQFAKWRPILSTRPKRVIPRALFDIIRDVAHPDYLRDRTYLRQYFANFEPSLIAQANKLSPSDFDLTSVGRRATYIDEEGAGYQIASAQWMESVVHVELNAGIVTKSVSPTYAHLGIWDREIEWLNRFQHTDIVPELLDVTPTLMRTRYVGEPVSEYTLPLDWRDQADRILAILAEQGCAHNDIAAANILVADGQLRLIDFAWALPIGAAVPAAWPPELGRHRLAHHQFDDRHALFEALGEKEAMAGLVAASQQAHAPTPPAPSAPPRQ